MTDNHKNHSKINHPYDSEPVAHLLIFDSGDTNHYIKHTYPSFKHTTAIPPINVHLCNNQTMPLTDNRELNLPHVSSSG